MSPSPRRNLEIKARTADLGSVREVVRGLCGQLPTVKHQTDTYFVVPSGRLKLHEIDGRPAC